MPACSSRQCRFLSKPSGDGEIRTHDPLLARQVLSQLSYTPICWMGLNGLEPSTSRLSGVRSNQLSYKPISIWQPPTLPCRLQHSTIGRPSLNRRVRDENGCVPWTHRHQKCLGYLIVASALVTISNPLRFFSMELLASSSSENLTFL